MGNGVLSADWLLQRQNNPVVVHMQALHLLLLQQAADLGIAQGLA
ncbi:hypothetical protein SDC9_104994 [bioreactor metagenome]|uniref:Uncharacterized protein n=1 Tax=bioreactor metagenome TaxID=1076179 RepID=A0A645AY40_9ZZZZ